ncbi:hypothetical protein COU49_02180 [Candidatus Nomurabacteria bacterium CG10_big_fil_rev_8_21_14_0_10_35_16]|uniref:General secretion pathway GspH domain-containing protein n=1 Tax=Candidatus Nomurabacteria bacterium CG10_big_fil_rev_8_21_14_0_10_35_16 TaxID=1974731 RepID=A0A2H0TAW2_9BACT|nr:MAG: hypothetical protein COU49_02180 [Candidatus Nomurabacteria bacterium CG10_big_fil_rev_8_21_14_0_10_35_16]
MYFQFFKKLKNFKLNRGMSYVELIVVLSIFSIMSSLIIFNYAEFQERVEIKNLANDIALKMVDAQKSSIFGRFPSLAQQAEITPTWKPSYGIYVDLTTDNKSFIYFVDLNNDNAYQGTDCTGECVDKISITKGNYISSLDVVYQDATIQNINDLTLSFTRPDSTAIFQSSSALGPNISHVQISIISPQSIQSFIKLYASGRIQIN